MSSAAMRSTSAPGSSVVSSMTLGPFRRVDSGVLPPGAKRGSEAESRARGNNAGPLGQAPSARLLGGLSGTKHRRLRRAPHPIFTLSGRRRATWTTPMPCQGVGRLPDSAESEGFDRTHIDLPARQLALLDRLTAAHVRPVVVLSNGSVV